MGINFRELTAFRLANEKVPDMIERLLNADDINSRAAYMADYAQMPEEMQRALGYMRCLVESSFGEAYSAYGRFSMEWFQRLRVPPMQLPMRFIGWAGPHNNIGPAYEIVPMCLSDEDSRIFYTDDDIENRPEYAADLAKDIARQSTGIDDVRHETLKGVYTMKGIETGMVSGVTFRLSEAAKQNILVGGKEMTCGEHGGAIFVLPKAGEFTCTLGEVLGGDASNCVILAKHTYCMK